VADEVPRLVDRLLAHHRGARLVVTSFDSGRFVPGAKEVASGWNFADGVAVSPPLACGLSLPSVGFDEWYVFDEVPGPRFAPEVFVNYVPFPLQAPLALSATSSEDDPWRPDAARAAHRFWLQLETLRPISYVARAHSDVVVTRREQFMQELLLAE
jgi:hypothetical protein